MQHGRCIVLASKKHGVHMPTYTRILIGMPVCNTDGEWGLTAVTAFQCSLLFPAVSANDAGTIAF